MSQIIKASEKFFIFSFAALFVGLFFGVWGPTIGSKFSEKRNNFSVAGSLLGSFVSFPQGTLHQIALDGVTGIPENSTVTAGTVNLGISFPSTVIAPLRLQVEVRLASTSFTGIPMASSSVIFLSKQGTVLVSGLSNGSYHWQARLVDVLTGTVSSWQEFGTVANVDFTVALREPVVIVPGISGSILQKTSDGSEVWPNIAQMLVSPSDDYLSALALNATGNALPPGTIRVAGILADAKLTAGGATLFSDDFYGNLINAFAGEGYVQNQNLFTAPYDWRLDINTSVAVLAAKITQAVVESPTGKINIVAHSMGGLVLKKYLAGLAPGASAAFLDKVVMVGVPELGAPYAFKILNYGDDLDIPIVNPSEIKKITQNMPSIYELLPSPRYVNVAGDYVQDFREGAGDALLDYADSLRVLMNNPSDARNASLLNLGSAFHQSIDYVPVGGPAVYTITGCGKPTITGFDLYDNNAVDLERGSGDGTVPEVSAMDLAASSHDYFVLSGETGIDHAGLMSDARPIALIKNIVDGNAGAALPSGISMRESDCSASPSSSVSGSDTTIEFSAVGSLSLGVYDSAGDFTGVTTSGVVVQNIPGSQYEQLGSSTFVTVLAKSSTIYRAVGGATASGTFALKVRGYQNGGLLDREANYLSVSAADTSTIAELDFSGFGKNDTDLKLGHRGHTNVEKVHHIDSLITAQSVLRDRVPPIITVAPLPRAVIQNATATLSFTATDLGSGVATTTATFNGALIPDGATLQFTQLGTNSIIIQSIDNAGNPRTKQIQITVRAQ